MSPNDSPGPVGGRDWRPRDPDAWLARDREDAASWSGTSERGMVSSAQHLATAAGASILARGGNAFDAAVATSLALGVCESASSGLGGMGMALAYHAPSNRCFALPGACLAPLAATPAAVSGRRRYRGYGAVAVPRLPAVLLHLWRHYATQSLDALARPAIDLAEEGFLVTPFQERLSRAHLAPLLRGSAGSLVLDEEGKPRAAGSTFRQPALAATLRRLAGEGLESFYAGSVAADIERDMVDNGGFVRRSDLEQALALDEREPLSIEVDGATIATLGPPAGGLTLLHMLQMAARAEAGSLDLETPDGIVAVAKLIQRARSDRRRYRLRHGFDHAGDAGELLDPVLASIAAREALGGAPPEPARSGGNGETTHLVTMDEAGSVVSLTQSIERSFGAAEVSPGLGFLYNGYLRGFKLENREHPHFLLPGRPARSNSAPTLALRDGRPWVALGSTGSERMCSGIFEVFLRLKHETPFEAVSGARLHASPGGDVLLEEDRLPRGTAEALRDAGFAPSRVGDYSFKAGGLQLVTRRGAAMTGVADPRRDGAAAGPDSPSS